MADIKICPDCKTEYYSHIAECADCGTTLQTEDEMEAYLAQRVDASGETEGGVVIQEGEKGWLRELYSVLLDKGFSCKMTLAPGCCAGGCGETFVLVVPKLDAEEAATQVEKYIHAVHPELEVSRDATAQGKCPACGHEVGIDTKECSDCGLLLILEG